MMKFVIILVVLLLLSFPTYYVLLLLSFPTY